MELMQTSFKSRFFFLVFFVLYFLKGVWVELECLQWEVKHIKQYWEQVTFVDWKKATGVIKGVAGADVKDWRHPRYTIWMET